MDLSKIETAELEKILKDKEQRVANLLEEKRLLEENENQKPDKVADEEKVGTSNIINSEKEEEKVGKIKNLKSSILKMFKKEGESSDILDEEDIELVQKTERVGMKQDEVEESKKLLGDLQSEIDDMGTPNKRKRQILKTMGQIRKDLNKQEEDLIMVKSETEFPKGAYKVYSENPNLPSTKEYKPSKEYDRYQKEKNRETKDAVKNLVKNISEDNKNKRGKEKIPAFTEEENQKFYSEMRAKLEAGGSEEEVREIISKRAEERMSREIQNGKLSERIMDKIDKGLTKWDNIGKEGGWKGQVGKYGKMAASIALIGAISSLTLGGISPGGVSSPSTYIGRKLLMGIGLGGAMEALSKTNPQKSEKIKKIAKYVLLGGSAAFAVLSGGAVAGAAVAGSAAFGYGLSKLARNKSFEEKQANEIFENTKNKEMDSYSPEHLESSIGIIESELIEVMKYNRKMRMEKRIFSAALAVAGSMATLATSELVDVMNNYKTDIPENPSIYNPPNQNEETVAAPTDVSDTEKIDNEPKITTVEVNSRGAIETIKDLQSKVESQYEDISKAPENIQNFINERPEKIAIDAGLYRPGEENESAMLISGSTLEFNEEGDLILHSPDNAQSNTLLDNENGVIIEKQYAGKMFDSDHSGDHDNEIVNNKYQQLGGDAFISGEPVSLHPDLKDESFINEPQQTKIEEIKTNDEKIEAKPIVQENISGEKITEDEEAKIKESEVAPVEKTLEEVQKLNGVQEVTIDNLKELNNLTKGYNPIAGQLPNELIEKQIEDHGLHALVTETTGENKVAAQLDATNRVNNVLNQMKKFAYGSYSFEKLVDGEVKIMRVTLYK